MKKHSCLRLLALLLTLQCLLVSCLPADLLSPAVTTQEPLVKYNPNRSESRAKPYVEAAEPM